jgi:hypothetical protein
MIWFMRIDSFLDHALTALAALLRVKPSRFFAVCLGVSLARAAFLTGKPNWLNGLA